MYGTWQPKRANTDDIAKVSAAQLSTSITAEKAMNATMRRVVQRVHELVSIGGAEDPTERDRGDEVGSELLGNGAGAQAAAARRGHPLTLADDLTLRRAGTAEDFRQRPAWDEAQTGAGGGGGGGAIADEERQRGATSAW